MKSISRRVADAEAITTGSENPFIEQPERYRLGYHLHFGTEAERPRHYVVTDTMTGQSFDAVGEWAVWAQEAETARRRSKEPVGLALTFGVAAPRSNHAKP
jgi:hypothetical protein